MSRAMKEDLFTIKAIEAKGFKMEELILLSDEELEELPISQRLIEGVKIVKKRGGKTAEQIAEEIADRMTQDITSSVEVDVPVVVETYRTQTPEFIDIQVKIEEESIVDELEEDEVEIVRTETSPEDSETVVQVLKSKEYKSFQPYIKLLQNEVPKAILDEVDSTLLSELIEQRISEVKASAKKTK